MTLRVLNGEFAVHEAMGVCCQQCRDAKFIECKQKKKCMDCIKERIACFNQCVVTHYCPKIAVTGQVKSGNPGTKGKLGLKGDKGPPGPRARIDLCPTTKIRTSSGSYCTKRSCYPIKV